MYCVYIIQSQKDKSYYIGISSDLDKRIIEHNTGSTRYTKLKRPWLLVYHEKYQTRGEAITREIYLKRMKSKKYIEKLVSKGP